MLAPQSPMVSHAAVHPELHPAVLQPQLLQVEPPTVLQPQVLPQVKAQVLGHVL